MIGLLKTKAKTTRRICEKKNPRNNSIHKAYKSLSESLKKNSKKIITQDVMRTIKMIKRNCEM